MSIADGVPILGFTGVNGAGKTLLAVSCAIEEMKRGRRVYSTVPIESPHGSSEPITGLRQLLHIEDCIAVFDEVSVLFPSGQAELPPEVNVLLQTLRHRNIVVWWTAPAWARAHLRLREVTQGSVNVFPVLRRRVNGSPWPTPVLIGAGLFDTTGVKVDALPEKVMRRRLYLPRRLSGWGAYDTRADTPLLGRHLFSGGKCPDCGGSIPAPKHSVERHAELGIPYFDDDAPPRVVPSPADFADTVFATTENAPA